MVRPLLITRAQPLTPRCCGSLLSVCDGGGWLVGYTNKPLWQNWHPLVWPADNCALAWQNTDCDPQKQLLSTSRCYSQCYIAEYC